MLKVISHLLVLREALTADRTRLEPVTRLGDGEQHSIVQRSDGLGLTRQGVCEHLRVLQRVGRVTCERMGREARFTIRTDPIARVRDDLTRASAQWDETIARLRTFVVD